MNCTAWNSVRANAETNRPERGAEHGVDHRDHHEHPDRPGHVEAEHRARRAARRARTAPRRAGRTRARSRRGSRPCRSASPAAAPGCRRSARAAWSPRSPGTSRRTGTAPAAAGRAGRSHRAASGVEHPPEQGEHHARQHEQQRERAVVVAQLGEHPDRDRAGDPRASRACPPTRARNASSTSSVPVAASRPSGVSSASSRPSRISSSRSQRSASSMTWLDTSTVTPRVGERVEHRPQVAAQHRVEADRGLVEHQQLRAGRAARPPARPGSAGRRRAGRRPRRAGPPGRRRRCTASTSAVGDAEHPGEVAEVLARRSGRRTRWAPG